MGGRSMGVGKVCGGRKVCGRTVWGRCGEGMGSLPFGFFRRFVVIATVVRPTVRPESGATSDRENHINRETR